MKQRDDDPSPPDINMSKIPVGGGVAGLIFTVGCMLIFLLGVPVLWYFFAFAVAAGVGIAVFLHATDRSR